MSKYTLLERKYINLSMETDCSTWFLSVLCIPQYTINYKKKSFGIPMESAMIKKPIRIHIVGRNMRKVVHVDTVIGVRCNSVCHKCRVSYRSERKIDLLRIKS